MGGRRWRRISSAGPGLLDQRRAGQGLRYGVIIRLSSDNMIRTQISIEKHEYDLIRKEASVLGISIAELVRRAIRQALPPPSDAPWMRYAGLVESGDAGSSQSVDEIVYGSKD
jgi:hypothetical protein